MGISSLPAFRLTNLKRLIVAALGLCVLFVAVGANAHRGTVAASEDEKSETEAPKDATQQIRIKRLKPADPESTERMLANKSQSLSQGAA
jgi:hypothetical protein